MGATFDESGNEIHIVIPAKRRISELIFFTYISLFVVAIQFIVIQTIVTGDPEAAHWSGLIFATFAGLLPARRLSWFFTGKLEIIVGASTLTLRERSFGVNRSWDYKKRMIRSLRVLPHVIISDDTKALFSVFTRRRGQIAFNYGPQIITFGEDVDEAEALKIQKRLKPYIPA